MTLETLLKTQDLGKVTEVCEQVMNETFDKGKDPITTIIINAFLDNGGANSIDPDYKSMAIDLKYAISMLERAWKVVDKHNN